MNDFTLVKTADAVDHGRWGRDMRHIADAPAGTLAPGKTTSVIGLILDDGDTIEVCVRYKKAGDNKDIFVIHLRVNRTQDNKYYDTGIENWARQEWLLQESGDFRHRVDGAKWEHLAITAGFTLRKHPLGYQGGDEPLDNGAHAAGAPSAVVFDNNIWLFYPGREGNRLWYTVYQDMGGGKYKWREGHTEDCMAITGAPSAVSYNDKIYVFHKGVTQEGTLFSGKLGFDLRYNVLDPRKGDWGQWSADKQAPDIFIHESPSAVVYDKKIWIAHKGAKSDGSIWILTSDEEHGFTTLGQIEGATSSDSPGLVVYKNRLTCYYNRGGTLHTTDYDPSTGKFTTPTQVPNTGMSFSPNAVATAKNLYVFHKAWGQGARLYCNMWNGTEWSGDIEFTDSVCINTPGPVIFGNMIWVFHQGGKDEIRVKTVAHK